jgi:hypothetical protein
MLKALESSPTMPIPPYDGILNVLPPHLGDPRNPTDLSPYSCSIVEFCDHFGTTNERVKILKGFLNLREQLLGLGIAGFQWIGGSFVEDIENQEGRPPGDVDAVTFAAQPANSADLNAIFATRPELLDPNQTKRDFRVDHYLVPLSSPPDVIVDHTRYWCGLFSHRRDREWKGMLVAVLLGGPDEQAARTLLGTRP